MATKRIGVYLADDHHMFIDGIMALLRDEENIECLGYALNGKQLLDQLPKHHADVLLLDINMPETDGLEVLKQIKSTSSDLKVLVLTMYNTDKFVHQMIEAGADGYILKNTNKEELVNAITNVYNGGNFFSEQVTDTLISGLRASPESRASLIKLTRREQDVLKLILDEMTTSEIAASLGISYTTAESHRQNLLSKMGVRNTAGLVKKAIEMGLA